MLSKHEIAKRAAKTKLKMQQSNVERIKKSCGQEKTGRRMSSCALFRIPNYVDNKNLKVDPNNSELNKNIDYVPSAGDIIECVTKTCTYNGEVLSYSKNDHFITIRDGQDKNSNMHIINFKYVICIRKIGHTQKSFFTIPKVSLEDGMRRLEYAVKRIGANWKIYDASENAIQVFNALNKLYDDICWDGKSLTVLRCVVINEPFDENSAKCLDKRPSSLQALEQIKKKLLQIKLNTETIKRRKSGFLTLEKKTNG